MFYKYRIRFSLLAICMLVGAYILQFTVHSISNELWTESSLVSVNSTNIEENESFWEHNLHYCKKATEKLYDINTGSIVQTELCAITSPYGSVAMFIDSGRYSYAVKKSTDDAYRMLIPGNGKTIGNVLASSHNGRLVFRYLSMPTALEPVLVSYRNIDEAVLPGSFDLLGRTTYYKLNTNKQIGHLGFQFGNDVMYGRTDSFALSSNGNFLLSRFNFSGYVVSDLQNGSEKVINPEGGTSYSSFGNEAAISNDGMYIYIGKLDRMYRVNGCGDELSLEFGMGSNRGYAMIHPCNFIEMSQIIAKTFPYQSYTGKKYTFSEDSSVLEFIVYKEYVYSPNDLSSTTRVTLSYRNSSIDNRKLDYLALGDSYSSGEGDIGKLADGATFYLPGTEGERGCHISVRSYPFLLAGKVNLNGDRMRSIACSGARISKDYYGSNVNYLGQGNKLKDKTPQELEDIRASSLSGYKPGINKQIEFVKDNKPKTVTITGGGNDIGFVNLIKSCISSYGPSERLKTCDEAVAGTKKRSILGDTIRTQYDTTVELIKELKLASGETTVYIVGYPSFTAENVKTCINAAILSAAERATINTGVSYMNSVLRAAAQTSGAHYVDIEDSLVGGRICEGSKYVTGMLNVITDAGQVNNMFHPNSEGHKKMADAISRAGFEIKENNNPIAQETLAPIKPNTFGSSLHVPTYQEKLTQADVILEVGKVLNLNSPYGIALTAGDVISFTLYSDPVDLGTYTVPQSGDVNASVKIPKSVKPGPHMVVAEVSSQGKILNRYYEYIEVTSGDLSDRDGDGIKDTADSCEYVNTWYDESTLKSICSTAASSQPGNSGNGPKKDDTHTPRSKWSAQELFKYYWSALGKHYWFRTPV